MSKSAIIACALLAALLGLLLLNGFGVVQNAAAIDTVHWTGSPLPPCFVNAHQCAGHLLGADANSRDVLTGIVVGARYTLGIALLALLIEFTIAGTFWVISFHESHVVEAIVAMISDGVSALPRLPLVLMLALVTALLFPHAVAQSPIFPALLLGLVLWPRNVSYFRGAIANVTIADRILSDLVTVLLLGATLDFFGLGVQPAWPSWGNMLLRAQKNIEVAWWAVLFPAAALFIVVLLLEIIRRGLPAHRAQFSEVRSAAS